MATLSNDVPWTLDDALRVWARRHFDLGSSPTEREIQTAFLRQIELDESMPGPQTAFAFAVLTAKPGASLPKGEGRYHARLEIEADLRKEVDQFASRFFEDSPEDRRKRYHDLKRRCSWVPSLSRFLARFEPVLNLIPSNLVGERGAKAQLACWVCELFVLRPFQQASRRRELLEMMAPKIGEWKIAAQEIRLNWPELGKLEPEFFRYFADHEKHEKLAHQEAKIREHPQRIRKRNLWTLGGIGCLLGTFFLYSSTRPSPKIDIPPPRQDFLKVPKNDQNLHELLKNLRNKNEGRRLELRDGKFVVIDKATGLPVDPKQDP